MQYSGTPTAVRLIGVDTGGTSVAENLLTLERLSAKISPAIGGKVDPRNTNSDYGV